MGCKPRDLKSRGMPGQEGFKHGTRARYVAGCRCTFCTKANLTAYHERMALAELAALHVGGPDRTSTHCIGVHGKPCPNNTKLRIDSIGNICAKCREKLVWNGLVPADRARIHLNMLSKEGVGRRAVYAATGVSMTILQDVKTGKKKQIRALTEGAILSVQPEDALGGALVDASHTWRKVRRLMDMGFSKAWIAQMLGNKSPALQISEGRVLASTARAVAELLEEVEIRYNVCPQCGYSHKPKNRRRLIRRMLEMAPEDREPDSTKDIMRRWPCFYPPGNAGERKLYRDMQDIAKEKERERELQEVDRRAAKQAKRASKKAHRNRREPSGRKRRSQRALSEGPQDHAGGQQ